MSGRNPRIQQTGPANSGKTQPPQKVEQQMIKLRNSEMQTKSPQNAPDIPDSQDKSPGPPKIKICGLSRPEDIEAVNLAKPDFCGFIVNFPRSRRNIRIDTLRKLSRLLSPEIQPVGVFVDQPPGMIAELLNEGTIRIAQLHGSETAADVARLRSMTDRPIWQAFQIRTEEDVRRAAASTADLILCDAGQGSGTTFSWELLSGLRRPFALAGGLNEANLPDALATGACLYDISGGVETDGRKDPDKILRLVELFRRLTL